MLGFGSRNSLGIVCPCPVVSQALCRALVPLPFDRQGVVNKHCATVRIRIHDVVVPIPAAPDGADDAAVLGGEHALQAGHRRAAPGVRVCPRHQAVQALGAGGDQVDCGRGEAAGAESVPWASEGHSQPQGGTGRDLLPPQGGDRAADLLLHCTSASEGKRETP